jgi:hypothetical protein
MCEDGSYGWDFSDFELDGADVEYRPGAGRMSGDAELTGTVMSSRCSAAA